MNKELERRLSNQGLEIVLAEIAKSYDLAKKVITHHYSDSSCPHYRGLYCLLMRNTETQRRDLVLEFEWDCNFHKGFTFKVTGSGYIPDRSESKEECNLVILPENMEWMENFELPKLDYPDRIELSRSILYKSLGIFTDEDALENKSSIHIINLFSRNKYKESQKLNFPEIESNMLKYEKVLSKEKKVETISFG